MPKFNLLKFIPFLMAALLSVSTWAVDTDGDGYDDAVDAFPNDPGGAVDTDGDGMPDEIIGGTLIDSFESGDFSAQPWVVNGNWRITAGTDETLGNYKAEVAILSPWLEVTVTFSQEASVLFYDSHNNSGHNTNEYNFHSTFDETVSSSPVNIQRYPHGYDAFNDGGPWNKRVYRFPAGTHTLRWRHDTICGGCYFDLIYLDGIHFSYLIEDTDDDNDGRPDVNDMCPKDSLIDTYVDTFPDAGILDLEDPDHDLLCNDMDSDDDGDGMPDEYENAYVGLNPLINDASEDLDADGLSNFDEFLAGSNPTLNDSDGDTVVDSVDNCPTRSNINQADLDGDGVGDACDFPRKNDTDADNDSDIVWRNRNTGVMTIWEMQNHSKASETSIGGLGSAYDLKDTFDLDSDGDSDLILFDESQGKAIAWTMENNNKVSGSFLAGFPGYTIRGLGDLDADGDGDIVWQEVSSGKVIVWIMEGGAKQSGTFLGSLGAGSVVEAIGDFDNDGDDDLLWSIPSATALVRWDMENGIKATGASIGGFPGYSIKATGDVNGDATDDILWQENSGGISIVWFMQNGTKQSGAALGVLPGYLIHSVGDFDADGDGDILWESTGTAGPLIWEMEGGTKQSQTQLEAQAPADSDLRP